ncbi:MAG TPA: SURF1 family protein [Paucimonas sp.]|nr:SURF1 family protein [Paucimonas sp.]HJW56426.1 SURF1 family protein [Burkholderiaceae bacterium]
MPITFHFRRIPFVATVFAVAVGVLLGQWQGRRAVEKEAIETTLSAREAVSPLAIGATPVAGDAVEYRRVMVKGEFVRDWPVYLDNRPYHGAAGFYLLMPLKIAGSSMHVLIVRGWLPRNASDRVKLPDIPTPSGVVEIDGMARQHEPRLLQLGDAEAPHPHAILQNLEAAEFAAASKLPMQPFLIEQSNDTHDGLIRDWPRPSSGIDKHRGYAFQWYALAVTALLFFVVTGWRRGAK